MARAGKGMGHGTKPGQKDVGTADPNTLRERDIASDIHGRNRLQGEDQSRVRNQRLRTPKVGGATGKARGRSGQRGE